MTTLINNVFKSMDEDSVLATEYDGQFFAEKRKAFYLATSKPKELEPKLLSEQEFERLIKNSIYRLLTVNSRFYDIQINLDDIDTSTGMFNVSITSEWCPRSQSIDNTPEYHPFEYTSKRPIKLSKLYSRVILSAKQKFCEQWGLHFPARDENVVTNEIMKSFENMTSADKLYLYFTKYNIDEHYNIMKRKLSLSSCMAYDASEFGNTYDGRDVHPLLGYQYAPDFRLCLVSTLSPKEIKHCTEYPFIARAMVFRGGKEPLAYSKVYGDERVDHIFGARLEHIKFPASRQFYAIYCDGVHNAVDSEIGNTICKYYKDHKICGHLIAPYIDTWSNNFLPISETLEQFDSSHKGMLMTVVHRCTDEDDPEFEDYTLEMNHADAIVRWQTHDGRRTNTYTQRGDLWVDGEEDFDNC